MATLDFLPDRTRWRVRWRATNRTSHTVFSGSRCFVQKSEAVEFWADAMKQERSWRAGEIGVAAPLSALAADFERYCTRHTATTQRLYRQVITSFLASLPPTTKRIRQIDAQAIDAYLFQLREQGACNRTMNCHLTVIKAFCHFCADRLDVANPARNVRMLKEDPPQSRFITPAEYQTLLERADPVNRDRLVFLANTGLRASEFSRLTRSGQLCPDVTSVTVIGKGRRRRTVPLNTACTDCLSRPHIYAQVGRNALFQAFSKIARRAGMPSLGPHALRHYFATQMLLAGVPIALVAKLLGHSVRICESVYSHILPPDLQALTAVLDARAPVRCPGPQIHPGLSLTVAGPPADTAPMLKIRETSSPEHHAPESRSCGNARAVSLSRSNSGAP